MRGYHCCKLSGSGVRGVPHPRFLRVGALVWNAKGVETVLRARASSFCDVQLLPAAAVARNETSKKLVHQGTSTSSPGVRIPSRGLCGDAQSRASVDERTKEGHAIHRLADAQA